MPLELAHLRDSLNALSNTLALTEDEARMTQSGAATREAMRAGAIKQFEITYELSWKLVRRWLNTYVSPGVADDVTKRQLFRLAAENRLIADVDVWMEYHKARNNTAHIYDQKIAEQVYDASKDFAHDARRLLAALETRND